MFKRDNPGTNRLIQSENQIKRPRAIMNGISSSSSVLSDDPVCWKTQMKRDFPYLFCFYIKNYDGNWEHAYRQSVRMLNNLLGSDTAKSVWSKLFIDTVTDSNSELTNDEQNEFIEALIRSINQLLVKEQYGLRLILIVFLHHRLSQELAGVLYARAISSETDLSALQWALICRQVISPDMYEHVNDISYIMPIRLTVWFNNPTLLEQLIQAGAQLDLKEPNQTMLSEIAALGGFVEILRILKKNTAGIIHYPLTLLIKAVQEGELDTVEFLIKESTIKEQLTSEKWFSLLHTAVDLGNLAVVQNIMQNHPDSHQAVRSYLLHHASDKGHLDIVNYLISQNAPVEQLIEPKKLAPLFIAAEKGHLSVVESLLQHGAKHSQTTPDGWAALHIAAQHGHLSVVESLLQHGAKHSQTTQDGWAALHIAASNGHLSVVESLLQHGADLSSRGNNGSTALHLAAEKGHLAIVDFLLQKGAVVHWKSYNGRSALDCAALEGHLVIVKRLLKENIDIFHKDNWHYTALHKAVKAGHLDVVRYLLKKIVDKRLLNQIKATLLKIAEKNQHWSIVRLLIQNHFVEYKALMPHVNDAIGLADSTRINSYFENGYYVSNREMPEGIVNEIKKRSEENRKSREDLNMLIGKATYAVECGLQVPPSELQLPLPPLQVMPIGFGPDGKCYLTKAMHGDRNALTWINNYDTNSPGAVSYWLKQAGNRVELFCLAVQLVRVKTAGMIVLSAKQLKDLYNNPQSLSHLVNEFDLGALREWITVLNNAPEMSMFRETCYRISHCIQIEELKKLAEHHSQNKNKTVTVVSQERGSQPLISSFFKRMVGESDTLLDASASDSSQAGFSSLN